MKFVEKRGSPAGGSFFDESAKLGNPSIRVAAVDLLWWRLKHLSRCRCCQA